MSFSDLIFLTVLWYCIAILRRYDKDSNGTLSKREIKGAILGMRKDLALPPPTSRDEEHAAIETSFAKIDADGDGVVNAQEFESFLKETLLEIARCLQEHPITVALLDGSVLREIVKDKDEFDRVWRELFTLADTNGDGKLTKKEVKPTVIGLAEMLGIPSPTTSIEAEEMVNAAFAEIDRDGDRYIQRDEFEDLIRGALLTVADRLHKHPVTVVVQE